jgi:hypothetical protein
MTIGPTDRSEGDPDAATLEEYRRTIEEAAAQLGASGEHAVGQRVAGATAALFAALARRDAHNHAMRQLVAAVAALQPMAPVPAELVEQARALVP